MSQDELHAKIRHLEERIEHLEHFIMESLMFRVEDLTEVVETFAESNPRNREVFADIRHLTDKARVAGWTDDGP